MNSLSLQQIQKTSNFDANLISRQYKLNHISDFMRIKHENPKLKESQIANHTCLSTSTSQRYKYDKNKLSPYKNTPNSTNKRSKKASNFNFDKNSYRDLDVKRPQMTSNDLKTTQTNVKPNNKNKNILRAESVQENIQINEHYLDEILDNNEMDLAMQIVSTDKNVRNDTIQDLKEYNNQYLATQAKKRRTVGKHDACF